MLAGSGGFARCGHCHQVFDARSNLLDPHAGEHDTPHTPKPDTPPPEIERELTRDEVDDEHIEDVEPEVEPERESEGEPRPEFVPPDFEPPLEPEPPLSAEVPPLVAPVFAPEPEHLAGEPAHRLEPPVESSRMDEEQEEQRPESEVEPPHEATPPTAGPIEPAHDAPAAAIAQPTWAQHDPHWHDDEPRFNGRSLSESDEEPHFGAAPAAQPEPLTRAEPEFAGRGDRRDVDQARLEDEPHLEPHLRTRLQAQAEQEGEAEPRFGAAADETPMRAASAPPIFPEPAASDEDERHFAVTRETRARAPSHVFGYIVGAAIALALVIVLIAQLAWWRREAVMVYWPESQPLFARACAQLGCRLSPPRDIDGLQVEASDLRQVDGPHRLELRVPLRNRYGIALAYPAIELTLTDNKNDIAIRRVLWPQDYVPPGTQIAAGLPAHATQTMIVRLDSGNAIATNFRVQIFYP